MSVFSALSGKKKTIGGVVSISIRPKSRARNKTARRAFPNSNKRRNFLGLFVFLLGGVGVGGSVFARLSHAKAVLLVLTPAVGKSVAAYTYILTHIVIGRVKSTATQQRASKIEFKLSNQLLSCCSSLRPAATRPTRSTTTKWIRVWTITLNHGPRLLAGRGQNSLARPEIG